MASESAPAPRRGQLWSANLEPQGHRSEPGKTDRPVLILSVDQINDKKGWNVIVVPGTTDVDEVDPGSNWPLRIRVQKTGSMTNNTDLLISQIRSISKDRLRDFKATLPEIIVKKAARAAAMIIGAIPLAAE